jgi:hypothetical protein
MREEMQNDGITDICSSGPAAATLAGRTVTHTAACSSPAVQVAINNGLSVSLPASDVPATRFSLSTVSSDTSQDLFGADGVITLSY